MREEYTSKERRVKNEKEIARGEERGEKRRREESGMSKGKNEDSNL